MATATAWFSSTTGVGRNRMSCSYSAAICAQSVSPAAGAVAWQAAMAACTWYGPGWPRRSPASRIDTPSPISAPSHRDRSWSSSVTRSPAPSSRAARRASCSSIRASRPEASGSSGISETSTRASRIASAHRFCRTRSAPAVAE